MDNNTLSMIGILSYLGFLALIIICVTITRCVRWIQLGRTLRRAIEEGRDLNEFESF